MIVLDNISESIINEINEWIQKEYSGSEKLENSTFSPTEELKDSQSIPVDLTQFSDSIKTTDDIDFQVSSSDENIVNQNRRNLLNVNLTNKFIDLIREENFEFGYVSDSEKLINEQLAHNELATKNWINEIFISNYDNTSIIIGILRIIGRFKEEIIFPQGHTLALAALMHENDEVKELGIRAFENWASNNSLKVLSNIKIEQDWLDEYKMEVIADLKEEICQS